MGLESAPQNPLGRIDPSSIVSRASEVVTPSAVDAFSDAVRKGFISAEDISARVQGEVARTEKTKLEELLAKEEQGPEAVKARSAERQAKGAEAGARAAIAPTALAAKESELKAAILDAQMKGSGVLEMQNALAKAGWSVPIDPTSGMTQANQQEILRRFTAMVKHTSDKTRAKDIVENAKSQELKTVGPNGEELGGPSQSMMYQGQVIPAEKFKQVFQYYNETQNRSVQSLDATGATLPDIFGQSGQVQPATPAAPAEIPVFPKAASSQAEAVSRDAQLSQFLPDAVQPRSAAKPMVEMPTEATPGQSFGPLAMVTSKKDAQSKPYHEVEDRALIALNRAATSNKVLNDLERNNFDPTTIPAQARMAIYRGGTAGQIAASLTGMTPEERNYVSASASWLQGLLRLESGAAIAAKEQAWYDRTFFPVVGDDKSVQANKALARKGIENAMQQVINGRMTPQQYEQLREQVSGTPSGAPDASGEVRKEVALPSGRKVYRDRNGIYHDTPQ